ncbi:hypothetical protein E4U46_000842 [Claviceps purpurea]|nr:hypothetical protein E4U46_000842 [Claviceps purpurea]
MLGRFATNLESSQANNHADRGVRAMIAGTGSTSHDGRDLRHAFIVTGGSDKKLRFWDMARIENSCVFSGLAWGEQQPMYRVVEATSALTVNVEQAQPTRGVGETAAKASSSSSRGNSKASGGGGGRPPRSTVISVEQQQLLQSHLDAVLDVVVLEYPYVMSVSVDRSGVVFVFQ